ncbi:MAG: hypothetical protein AAGF23_07580 [Acidobacteriota bacterium]
MYGFHRTTWTLTDSRGTVRFRKDSRDVTIPTLNLPAGTYQVRAQRSYWPQLNGPSRSSTRTLQVLAASHPACAQICPGPGSGGGDGFPGNGGPIGTIGFCP